LVAAKNDQPTNTETMSNLNESKSLAPPLTALDTGNFWANANRFLELPKIQLAATAAGQNAQITALRGALQGIESVLDETEIVSRQKTWGRINDELQRQKSSYELNNSAITTLTKEYANANASNTATTKICTTGRHKGLPPQ